MAALLPLLLLFLIPLLVPKKAQTEALLEDLQCIPGPLGQNMSSKQIPYYLGYLRVML